MAHDLFIEKLYVLRFGMNVLYDTHREKHTQFITRIYWKRSLAASSLFHMFTQPITFDTFLCHILKSADVYKKRFIKFTKWTVAPFNKFYSKIWVGFCLNTGKRFFLNSPPFERPVYFYVKITGNFEPFQYFRFGTSFLKNEKFFQKTGVLFFNWKY